MAGLFLVLVFGGGLRGAERAATLVVMEDGVGGRGEGGEEKTFWQIAACSRPFVDRGERVLEGVVINSNHSG